VVSGGNAVFVVVDGVVCWVDYGEDEGKALSG